MILGIRSVMMTDKPSSLRDLYNAQDTELWSFAHSSPSRYSNHSSWNTPSRPRVFDLLPGSVDSVSLFGQSTKHDTLDVRSLFKDFMAFAVLQYASVAVVMPFEVAKILLQVQWIPRHQYVKENARDSEALSEDTVALSDSEDVVSYFREPIHITTATQINSSPRPAQSNVRQDLVARPEQFSNGRPVYVIPASRSDSVWGMIKRVGEWKSEGYLSLWKGQLTATLLEVLGNAIQPFTLSILMTFQDSPPTRLSSGVILPVLSHAFAAYALLPLDLLRTRLITQPSHPSSVTLPASLSPVNPLLYLISQQGGLRAIYLNPHLYIPALLDATIRPLLSIAGPVVIGSCLGLQADGNPFLYGLVELGWSAASLMITLPLETAKRRLQVQGRYLHSNGADVRYNRPATCVDTRPLPYRGVTDCIWRILTEECSVTSADSQSQQSFSPRSRSWSLVNDTGVLQLYRGFSMNMWAHTIVFVLSSLTGDAGYDRGWAEL